MNTLLRINYINMNTPTGICLFCNLRSLFCKLALMKFILSKKLWNNIILSYIVLKCFHYSYLNNSSIDSA